MGKERSAGKSLPQANPGNVWRALDRLPLSPQGTPVASDWLRGQAKVTQPSQTLSMLRFLGAINGADRLDAALDQARGHPLLFAGKLAEYARRAYQEAGCGTCGWLGDGNVHANGVEALVKETRPFSSRPDLQKGAAKNARYCLRALHDWLCNQFAVHARREQAAPPAETRPRQGQDSAQATFQVPPAPAREVPAVDVRFERAGSWPEARETARGLCDAPGFSAGPEVLKFPLFGANGMVRVEITFGSPPTQKLIAELGRMLLRAYGAKSPAAESSPS